MQNRNETAAIRDYALNDLLQSDQIMERIEAEKVGLVFSATKFREVISELGFVKTIAVGEWENEKIKIVVLTHCNFQVENDKRMYKGNYKDMLVVDLVEELFKLM